MPDDQTPLALIHGLRQGSRDAWAALYDQYSVDLWRYVARLLGHDATAVGDVVQDAFIEAARLARQFDSDRGTLWSWLVGIAHHRVSAHWRQTSRLSRLRQLAESGEIGLPHLRDGELDAKASLDLRETADFVRAALAELSPEYASLLTAKYLDDRSLAEIADQLGSSIDAIKSKLARARKEFRAQFEYFTKAADQPMHSVIATRQAEPE